MKIIWLSFLIFFFTMWLIKPHLGPKIVDWEFSTWIVEERRVITFPENYKLREGDWVLIKLRPKFVGLKITSDTDP